MAGRVMLGVIVTKVFVAGAPVDEEVALADAILEPVESHVHGFGAFLFDGVVGEAGGRGVVSLDGRGWLWVAKFFEGDTEG